MGVIMTNCCQNNYSNTELITSSSLTSYQFNDENLLKKIPEIKESNEGIDYITSKDCYQILIKKTPKIILIKRLCHNLDAQEIFNLIKQSINWILPAKIEKNDKNIQKYILMIKNYTKFGTKKILDDLEQINYLLKKEDEIFLLQSLSDWAMLIELIIFLNNKRENNNNKYNNRGTEYSLKNVCTVYDINLWYNKNLGEIIKKYCFDGIYFLVQIKMKYKQENKNLNKFVQTANNTKVNSDTKNEIKKIFILIEDFVKEISE